jgi:hypothetical protein
MPDDVRRLAVHIPAAIDLRLRIQSGVSKRQMGEIVADALDEHLPSAEVLGDQIAGRDTADVIQ